MVSLTSCYLYFHKILGLADFHTYDSPFGIYPVLKFEAIKIMQYRLLVPWMFKVLSLFLPPRDKLIYFALSILLTMLILCIFYLILNEYFVDKKINALIAPVILYPMIWNFTILNGQAFYVDFSILVFILLGYYAVIKDNIPLLLISFLIGCINHDSIGFVIVMYLLYNYKKIFTLRVISTTAAMVIISGVIKYVLYYVFIDNFGVTFRWNYERNYTFGIEMPISRIMRNVIFIFGGLHLFVLAGIRNAVWKSVPEGKIMINLTFIPYLPLIFLIHSIEEIRNYIAAIPFILIPFLIYISSFKGSILKLKTK